VMARIYCRRIQ